MSICVGNDTARKQAMNLGELRKTLNEISEASIGHPGATEMLLSNVCVGRGGERLIYE